VHNWRNIAVTLTDPGIEQFSMSEMAGSRHLLELGLRLDDLQSAILVGQRQRRCPALSV
jgi:hypothetical protein